MRWDAHEMKVSFFCNFSTSMKCPLSYTCISLRTNIGFPSNSKTWRLKATNFFILYAKFTPLHHNHQTHNTTTTTFIWDSTKHKKHIEIRRRRRKKKEKAKFFCVCFPVPPPSSPLIFSLGLGSACDPLFSQVGHALWPLPSPTCS